MNDPKIIKALESLAKKEYENASAEHGNKFNTPHEAYAVMKEEYEEAEKELNNIDVGLNKHFWKHTKDDNTFTNETVQEIYVDAILGAYELLQLAAMAYKTNKGYEAEYYNK